MFLEVNASGQWGWIEYTTGQRITEAIVDALVSHQGGKGD
jgi:glutathione synthase/RimK-type ligase-like ATP-grasp enzyme